MKNVVMERRTGDFLIRFDKKFKKSGIEDKNFISVLVPEKEASEMKRFGGNFNVSDNENTSKVFKNFSITKIEASNLAEDENKEFSSINQNALTVEKVNDNVYKLKVNVSDLKEFKSTNPSQAKRGNLKWLGVIISTGEETIEGIKFNNYALSSSDIEEASSIGSGAGTFVFWTCVEDLNTAFTLEYKEKSSVIELVLENTAN